MSTIVWTPASITTVTYIRFISCTAQLVQKNRTWSLSKMRLSISYCKAAKVKENGTLNHASLQTEIDSFANSENPDETAHYDSGLDLKLTSLFISMDISRMYYGQVHFRNLGVKVYCISDRHIRDSCSYLHRGISSYLHRGICPFLLPIPTPPCMQEHSGTDTSRSTT